MIVVDKDGMGKEEGFTMDSAKSVLLMIWE